MCSSTIGPLLARICSICLEKGSKCDKHVLRATPQAQLAVTAIAHGPYAATLTWSGRQEPLHAWPTSNEWVAPAATALRSRLENLSHML